MDREAWRAAIMGSQRVGHDWVTELNWVVYYMYIYHVYVYHTVYTMSSLSILSTLSIDTSLEDFNSGKNLTEQLAIKPPMYTHIGDGKGS